MKGKIGVSLFLVACLLALSGCAALPASPDESSFSFEAPAEEADTSSADTTTIDDHYPPLAGSASSGESTVPKDAGRMAAEIFELCNAERAKHDLPPFLWSDDLYKIADIRAGEIIVSFSHTRPNGKSCLSLFEDRGLKYSHVGENVAIGHSTAKQVVDSWMKSKGHKANILGPSTHFAVAYEKCPPESIYNSGYAFAQEFMTPR